MLVSSGDLAPDFAMPDTKGNIISLSDPKGQRVILFFYLRDNTPGCTKEAWAFHTDIKARVGGE
ncbi:MAG: redoxin domain-containing protein [Phormidesmis sp.]